MNGILEELYLITTEGMTDLGLNPQDLEARVAFLYHLKAQAPAGLHIDVQDEIDRLEDRIDETTSAAFLAIDRPEPGDEVEFKVPVRVWKGRKNRRRSVDHRFGIVDEIADDGSLGVLLGDHIRIVHRDQIRPN